ncbi:MAG: CRISPR-associated protein Cas5, partial [Weeksellaceae bacterium]|nr:CRISPR-associated protein Cas5 [Weeksellaceae bacterium]
MEKLISIDLKADFGFFRKPDTNNTINLSYNIIHKPAILGILGAIIGLEGYTEKG